MRRIALILGLALLIAPTIALAADDVGRVKVASGAAHIDRRGAKLPAQPGLQVREGDVVVTGADGSIGITFADDTLLSLGPNSSLTIDRFAFDPTSHKGRFDTSLKSGTLAAVSGKLAKQSPDAMKVKTPGTILGIRGTEFLIRLEDAPPTPTTIEVPKQ